jgi:exosortase
MNDSKPNDSTTTTSQKWIVVSAGIGLLAVVWAYWDPWSQTTSLGKIAHDWEHKPVYSHGYLVPLFAIGLLWFRKDQLKLSQCSPSCWGLIVIGIAAGLRLAGGYYYFEWFDFISILPMFAGLCLMIGGANLLKWAIPSIAFLFFMLPLPYSLEVGLRTPLQRLGTVASCYTLQTLGLPAYAEGNQIHGITEQPLEVEQACSGLGMMMVFFALCTAVVYLISNRPPWERLFVLLSAAPIAIFANVLRISATGTLYAWGFDRAAHILHEQLSAFLMMPVALGLLWLELWFFSKLILVEEDTPMSAKLQLHSAGSPRDQQIPISAGR